MWTQCSNCKLVQGPSAVCGQCGRALAPPLPPSPPPPAAAPPAGAQWHYLRDGRPVGPLPFDDLCAFARGGTLGPADQVWQQGTPSWVAAGTVAGLFPPPAPGGGRPPEAPRPALPPGKAVEPYLPYGARVRSRACAWWVGACLVLGVGLNALLFNLLSAATAKVRKQEQLGPRGVVKYVRQERQIVVGLIWACNAGLVLVAGGLAWRAAWLRGKESEYGLRWAEYLAGTEAVRRAWAGVRRPESEQHLRQLVAAIPGEPPAIYIGFYNVQPRTWTVPPGASKAVAVDFLKFLVFRNLLDLELPGSSVGWATLAGEWGGLFRVDLQEHVKLEVCFSVRAQGNALSLFWNAYVLWLLPAERNAFFARSLKDPATGARYLEIGAPKYKHVRYGHTAVWALVNIFRDRVNEIKGPWVGGFTFQGLNASVKAGADALVAKINADIEAAMAEFTPAPEFRPPRGDGASRAGPAPQW